VCDNGLGNMATIARPGYNAGSPCDVRTRAGHMA